MNSACWWVFSLGVLSTLASAALGAPPRPGFADFPPPLRLVQIRPPVEWGYSLPSVAMDALPQSKDCQTSLPLFGHPDELYWPPQGKMTMSNDGGWCWIQFGQVFNSLAFVPATKVIAQPANGQVQVEMMKDRVSVAYRPSPGFIGSDSFKVRTEGPNPHTIPIAVTVH